MMSLVKRAQFKEIYHQLNRNFSHQILGNISMRKRINVFNKASSNFIPRWIWNISWKSGEESQESYTFFPLGKFDSLEILRKIEWAIEELIHLHDQSKSSSNSGMNIKNLMLFQFQLNYSHLRHKFSPKWHHF